MDEKKKVYSVYMTPSDVKAAQKLTGATGASTAIACAARLAITATAETTSSHVTRHNKKEA